MARPPSYDRDTVMAAVERQFRKEGYAGTSLDDIAGATGLGRGSLYAAFGDKHQLFMESLSRYCDQLEASVVTSLAGPDEGALDRLKSYLTGPDFCSVASGEHLVCMAGKSVMELGAVDDQVAHRAERDFDAIERAFRECLQAAQRNGDLNASVDPAELATLLLVLMRGIDVVVMAGRAPSEVRSVIDYVLASCTRVAPSGANVA